MLGKSTQKGSGHARGSQRRAVQRAWRMIAPMSGILPRPTWLHDLAHLVELLDELVDLLDAGARAARDPQAPRALDQLRPRALLGGHRLDDRLDAVELALVDLEALHLLRRRSPGIIPSSEVSGPILRICWSWPRKSSSVNSLRRSLRSSSLASSSSNGCSRLLDQAQHVAHAEDPLRHAVGVEALELVELLARAREQDRLAGDRLDRQRRAAARVAVELGHHHAVELHGLGELLRDVDRVLAGHRVDDEQDLRSA